MTQDAVEPSAKRGSSEFFLKSFPLREVGDVQKIKGEVSKKTIVILRVTPLAQKNVDELRRAIEQLYEYSVSIGGDIARLGEERVVVTPPGVKIWRGLFEP